MVLGAVIMATASYSSSVLRFNQVVESRSANLAAAHGAMDDAIEQLRLRRSMCTTVAGASGVTTEFPELINGAVARVTCRVIGGSVPPSDGWAMVITGQGPVNDGLTFTSGGTANIGGPVFVPSLSSLSLSDTTIVEGDLWYQDASCAGTSSGASGIAYRRSDTTVSGLTFDPAVRGIYCVNRSWNELFNAVPTVAPPTDPVNPPYHLANGNRCRVFEPGVYTVPPDLGKSNYFRSGTYLFDGVGKIELQGQSLTMGQTLLEGFPATENPDCDPVRQADDPSGAVLYIDGNTAFEVRSNSSFEVSRRQVDHYWMAVHVLPGSNPTGGYLMSAEQGAQKEISIQGLLWAPNSSIKFGTIPARKAAVLRGGAVLGSFSGAVTAAAIGFAIEIPTNQQSTTLQLDATASNGAGRYSVRVIAEYRPSTGELAVNSWRVFQ